MTKVRLYTLSTCPWCNKTKKFFTDNKIAFEFVDFDLASDAEQERIIADIKKRGAQRTFPFVIIGSEVVVGYNPDKYKRLLKLP